MLLPLGDAPHGRKHLGLRGESVLCVLCVCVWVCGGVG